MWLRALVVLPLVACAARANVVADNAPASFPRSCRDAVHDALVSAFPAITVRSDDRGVLVELVLGREWYRLDIDVANGSESEDDEWSEEEHNSLDTWAGMERLVQFRRSAGRLAVQGIARGARLEAFVGGAKRAADRCVEISRAGYESAARAAWRRQCTSSLRAAMARATSRDAYFSRARLGFGASIRVTAPPPKGEEYCRTRDDVAELALDTPAHQPLTGAWLETIAGCAEANTRCELLRAPGWLGYVVSGDEHRGVFVEEIATAMRSCMIEPAPR